MIFQCPACRALAQVERAMLDEGGRRAGLFCAACQVVSWLPIAKSDESAGQKADSPLLTTDITTESKTPPSAADAVIEEAVLGLSPSGPEEQALVEGFRQLLPRWSDADAHRALIQHAHELGALPALGVRYRRVLEERPGDEAAKRAQQEILNLALATFRTQPDAAHREDAQKRARAALTLTAVGLLLVGACVFLFLTLRAL